MDEGQVAQRWNPAVTQGKTGAAPLKCAHYGRADPETAW